MELVDRFPASRFRARFGGRNEGVIMFLAKPQSIYGMAATVLLANPLKRYPDPGIQLLVVV